MFSSWNEVWEKPDPMKNISQNLSKKFNESSDTSDFLKTDDLITSESKYSSLLSDCSTDKDEIKEKCQNNWKHIKNCLICKEKLKTEQENIRLKQQISDLHFNSNDNIKEYFYMIVALIVIIFILYIIAKKL
jgi:hypothetical protein